MGEFLLKGGRPEVGHFGSGGEGGVELGFKLMDLFFEFLNLLYLFLEVELFLGLFLLESFKEFVEVFPFLGGNFCLWVVKIGIFCRVEGGNLGKIDWRSTNGRDRSALSWLNGPNYLIQFDTLFLVKSLVQILPHS